VSANSVGTRAALTASRSAILDRFAAVAVEAADRPAVLGAGHALTYGELAAASDVLAARLVELGVGQGALVGVMSDRSPDVATAYLATLKTGAAFVPLSHTAPTQRNLLILRESRVSVLLVSPAALTDGAASAAYAQAAHIVDIRTPAPAGRTLAADQAAAEDGETLDGAAYVIHTSGSTGQPKGAINTDAGLLNLVNVLASEVYPKPTRALNVALVAPFVFDPSVQQIFGALLQGHSLHIVPDEVRFDGGALLTFLNANEIDIADGTPTHLRLITNAPASLGGRFQPTLLLIGGEAMTPDIVRSFWARFGGREAVSIVNLYGTAECAVDSTFYFVDPAEVSRLGFVPIGRAFAGVDVQILDSSGRPIPAGETGEIALGGTGVGLGYLGQPIVTRQSFRTGSDGRPLYLTGDLGRLDASGLLQCLGRRDRQLKVRGVRIEPAEIELALCGFRRTDENRVVVRCERCLLDTRHPGVTVTDGICSVCAQFESRRNAIDRYFGDENDFKALMTAAGAESGRGEHDCLLLYSGGKDSSYVLLRLLEMGYRVATFTFDNGYISSTALENIERTTRAYGVANVTATLAQMKQVFAESLKHESTVCGGCFRALTQLSTQLARKRGINVVITGLSRGQIFETKLKRIVDQGLLDPDEIDRLLDTHRQIFNVREDPIATAVGLNEVLAKRSDHIRYVDFFRYDQTSSAEVRSYLAARDARWRAPTDTGFCSTNCRINDVGIRVHQLEKGYHNYAAPLSWDVRLGAASRHDAGKELAADVSSDVSVILSEIGYKPRNLAQGTIQQAVAAAQDGPLGQPVLCAYYVSSGRVNTAELRDHLATTLPEYMLPKHLIRMDALPLNASGKVDIARLPRPTAESSRTTAEQEGLFEGRLKRLWQDVLGFDGIEVTDNFFDLGGDSLMGTILVSLIETELGRSISVSEAFHHPTIREMARLLQA
jgi:amino acid adenylation domain-containing protein